MIGLVRLEMGLYNKWRFVMVLEMGGALQLMGIIRLLIDPENMVGKVVSQFGCASL